MDPKNIRGRSNYGCLLLEAGKLEEAEKQFKAAIELDPTKPGIHGAYSLLLFSENLEIEAIEEMKIASRLLREKGDIVREHLAFAWLYEDFANKYYGLRKYTKSGEYAEISGDKYIEAGKYAGEKFKSTSLIKGYSLKGRAKIRKLDFLPIYDVEVLKININGIADACRCYKMVAEVSLGDNNNTCLTSILCLSDILDCMLEILTQKNVPKIEARVEKWKEDLGNCENRYKTDETDSFIKALYNLVAFIENINSNKKSDVWKEQRAFNELFKELSEIVRNIEGPLQDIIEDSAKQMSNCRLKTIPYAGIDLKYFTDSTDKSKDLALNSTIKPASDPESGSKSSKNSSILRKVQNSQAIFSIKSTGGIISIVVLAIILTGVILKLSP